jgi:lipoate-protein ligase B
VTDYNFEFIGRVPYLEGRRIQEGAVKGLIDGTSPEVIFLCEHPITITLGRRADASSVLRPRTELLTEGIEIHSVKRGGEATLHLPGQLVIYPVISLRNRGLGVRDVVCRLLSSLRDSVLAFGLEATVKDNPAGLFTTENRKIGAIGLELKQGVTNHGMSLNVSSDIGRYDNIGKKVEIDELLPHLKKGILSRL